MRRILEIDRPVPMDFRHERFPDAIQLMSEPGQVPVSATASKEGKGQTFPARATHQVQGELALLRRRRRRHEQGTAVGVPARDKRWRPLAACQCGDVVLASASRTACAELSPAAVCPFPGVMARSSSKPPIPIPFESPAYFILAT